jgi:exonuclease SbcD
MKFVHIGDLHLGKVLHQYSLLDIQRELLFELLEYMEHENIKVLVIAGDVYDRLIPSQEAVNVLDEFLSQAILKYHIQILMISGNHDSSDRMHFASSLLSSQGLHIATHLKKEMEYVEIGKSRFYLLPFFKPSQVKSLYEVDLHTYQEAMAYYLSQQTIDNHYQNILITHQFVGRSSLTCESEMPLSVGGSEIIDAHLFEQFDYVALGHLHSPQKVSKETIRYSGSLMCYSFDEVNHKKSIVVVDTDNMSIHLHSLHPSLTLKKYKGTFEQLMNKDFISQKEDYLSFELEDTTLIPHAVDQLRLIYPHVLQITYSYLTHQQSHSSCHSIESLKKMDNIELFTQFYKDVKNMELNEQQYKIIKELLEKAGELDESH